MSPSSARQDAPDAPRRASIPLAHKRVPTETRAPADHAGLLFAALVGDVDISELRAYVAALPRERWQEDYNRRHNVFFQRPFHDKLGVENVMCVFSDTQLENVFVLPRYEEFRRFLEPIFAQMNVKPEQVVRCLFAKMPGETLIPAHHDNGPWVSKTHRIHVPIVTFPNVEFRSGPLEESMQRFAFNEGTIVELNNAAKHAVYNGSKEERIHLIFDYVEPYHVILNRKTLEPGCVCRQVRGRVEFVSSVDQKADNQAKKEAGRLMKELEKHIAEKVNETVSAQLTTGCRHFFIEQITALEFVKRVDRLFKGQSDVFITSVWGKLTEIFKLIDIQMHDEVVSTRTRQKQVFAPNWVIIGAQKCGTTSLYEYLAQHPQVLRGNRREPHFFDWVWPAAVRHELSESDRAKFGPVLSAFSRTPEHDKKQDGAALGENSLDDMRIKYLMSMQYDEEADAKHRAIVPPFQIGESTPSYLLYGETVARRMRMLYPDMKLIVMLRDPVKRAYSHFQMTADPTGTSHQLRRREAVKGKSFAQVVDEDLELLRSAQVSCDSEPELLPVERLADRFQVYADALPQDHGAHSYVGRGLYALQLALWLRVFPREQVLVVDLDDMSTHDGIHRETNRVFDFLELPEFEVHDKERKNTRAYDPVDPEDAQKLREFYAPHNEQLFELVGRRFNW